MAKATPRGGVTTNRTLKLAHTAAVEDGDVIVSNGQVLVAEGDYAADEEGIYTCMGPVEFPKVDATAIAVGDPVYWDAADGEINTDNANPQAGVCIGVAAAADTTVLVEQRLN